MIIKTNNKNTYLISPEETKTFLGINTEKYVVINKDTFTFEIKDINEEIVTETWTNEEIDGRKFRKLRKEIFAKFGDDRLASYTKGSNVYDTLSKKFINCSGVSEVLKNSLANNMNIILFGKGGFGKSEICNALFGCAELRDRVFIQSLSEATTEEDLFGGIKMKKFMDTGEKEYLVENSFANKEIVVFEEIFDANPRVLAALKDTLTSKEVRNGNQRFPIKTKIIIGLTNKTYDEVIEDDSTEALTQRFPVSYNLQYKLTKLNVASLVANRYKGFSEEKMAAIVETIEEMNDLTPRKVLEIAKYLKDLDIIKSRNYIEKITNNAVTPVINYIKNRRGIDCLKVLFGEIVIAKKNIRDEVVRDYDAIIDIMHNANIIKSMYDGVEIPTDISKANSIKALLSEISELEKLILKKIE